MQPHMSEPRYAINDVIYRLKCLNPEMHPMVIGVSGGADSVALSYCASLIFENVKLVYVSHNGYRSQENREKDEHLVKNLAEQLELKFASFTVEVDEQKNWEKNARELRYEALVSACYAEDAPGIKYKYIATAHHADDQLETILMRIARGTGIHGMRGVLESYNYKESGISVIRPLLGITKEACYQICKKNNLEWREDETNDDEQGTRNKIRHQILPTLREINPSVAQHASDLANIMNSTHNMITHTLDHLFTDTRQEDMKWSISSDALRLQPDIVIYEWIKSACVYIRSDTKLDRLNKKMLDNVVGNIRDRKNVILDWPQHTIEITKEKVIVKA